MASKRLVAVIAVVVGVGLAVVAGTGSDAVAARQIASTEPDERKVNVKFVEGTNPDQVLSSIAPELANSIAYIAKVFSLQPGELNEIQARGSRRSGRALPDLNLWFELTLNRGTNIADFLDDLNSLPGVEVAALATLPKIPPHIARSSLVPRYDTPSFVPNQGYLGGAPEGIAAKFAWTIPGGNGTGVTIFDVEYSWNQTHEDLQSANGIPLLLDPGDVAVDPFADDNHGTAVLGEMIGTKDKKGITGVSWGATVGLAPANTLQRGYNVANAILLAVADGSAGDVILIEQQQFVCGLPAFGPSEVDPSVFSAIQTAVTNGFVVVEAAGNGNVDLDHTDCGNTFDRTIRDSGAIVVGAGLPPGSGADRQRASFSTFGSRIDVQGWGFDVMTTGYGDFYHNPSAPDDRNFWYTSRFSGTSSASPIVAGAAANLQGIALSEFSAPLTSLQIRRLLKKTGSRQLGNVAERIGPRPNLRKAINRLLECFESGFDKHGNRRVVRRREDVSPTCIGRAQSDDDFPEITHEWPR